MRRDSLSPQPWPWPGPRVLIENSDRDAALASASALRLAGYAVALCPGPLPSRRCPLVTGDDCALVRGADAIVSSLGLEQPEGRDVLEALKARAPKTPLVVGTPSVQPERLVQAVRAACVA